MSPLMTASEGPMTVRYQLGGQRIVPIGDDMWLPAVLDLALQREDAPTLTAIVEVLDDGTPICRELRLVTADGASRGVRSGDLRLSVEDLVQAACALATFHGEQTAGGAMKFTPTAWDVERHESTRRAIAQAQSRARRRLTDAQLREVAEVYNANTTAPTKAVEEHFDIPRRTAGLYVKRARDMGLIDPPAEKGDR